jgi:hypothetical protein
MSSYTISTEDRVICKARSRIVSSAQLEQELQSLKPGEEIDLHIWREN